MEWSFDEVVLTVTDNIKNYIWFSGRSTSDTIVFEDESNKIEMHIDDFKKIVSLINDKTNFLNEYIKD